MDFLLRKSETGGIPALTKLEGSFDAIIIATPRLLKFDSCRGILIPKTKNAQSSCLMFSIFPNLSHRQMSSIMVSR